MLPEAFADAWEAGWALSPESAAEAVALAAGIQAGPEVAALPARVALDSPADTAPNPRGPSRREVDVPRLVAEGITDAQIAARLFLSPTTVSAHLKSIYGKLGVISRAGAARFATEHGLVSGRPTFSGTHPTIRLPSTTSNAPADAAFA